jgi:hypothetical protein
VTARATIEATRTFTADGEGLPVAREVDRAGGTGQDLRGTPPPAIAALCADELGQRWLAATGVPNPFPHRAEEIDPAEAIGRAWVAATSAGWA